MICASESDQQSSARSSVVRVRVLFAETQQLIILSEIRTYSQERAGGQNQSLSQMQKEFGLRVSHRHREVDKVVNV